MPLLAYTKLQYRNKNQKVDFEVIAHVLNLAVQSQVLCIRLTNKKSAGWEGQWLVWKSATSSFTHYVMFSPLGIENI